MEIQASRTRARTDSAGNASPPPRSGPLRSGTNSSSTAVSPPLVRADSLGAATAPTLLQAAIAACHARAPTPPPQTGSASPPSTTASPSVAPSPIVELNRAVAIAMAFGPAAGLERVDALIAEPSLRNYHLLPAARADLLDQTRPSRRSPQRIHPRRLPSPATPASAISSSPAPPAPPRLQPSRIGTTMLTASRTRTQSLALFLVLALCLPLTAAPTKPPTAPRPNRLWPFFIPRRWSTKSATTSPSRSTTPRRSPSAPPHRPTSRPIRRLQEADRASRRRPDRLEIPEGQLRRRLRQELHRRTTRRDHRLLQNARRGRSLATMPNVNEQIGKIGNDRMTALQPPLKQLYETYQKNMVATPPSLGPAAPATTPK